MNKAYIPGVIIVEGKHDVSKLSLLYEGVYVVTNGYEIPEKEISFLKALDKNTQVIILTDKDESGKQIRSRLVELLPQAINIEIEAPKSSKKKGVAECSLLDIKNALDKYVKDRPISHEYNLYELGLMGASDSKRNRELVANRFNLGIINSNNIISRLNLLNIKEEEIRKVINNESNK